MEIITKKLIENEIASKQKMLEDFQNPEYIKSQGIVSNDNVPLEEKLKFIVNTLKYEISSLQKDLNADSEIEMIYFNNDWFPKEIAKFELRHTDSEDEPIVYHVILGIEENGKFKPQYSEVYKIEEEANKRFLELTKK